MTRLVTTAILAAAMAVPAVAHGHDAAGMEGGGPVAEPATLAETIAARQRFFGPENVDPRTGAVRRDRAIFAWTGVTNFALAIRGHVLLLDAWVPRGAHSGYVPTTPMEVAKLRPEAILIGHAHFDHAADAVPLAEATGAPLVGTAEHCADFRTRTTGIGLECIEAIPAGAAPGTLAQPKLIPGVELTVMEHMHSATTPPDDQGFHVPVTPLPSTTSAENPPTPEDMRHLVGHLPDAEGGTLLWRFRTGDRSIVWHDSAGPLSEQAPQVLDAVGRLGPVDIQLGAIQTFNQVTTDALRDPRQYIEALRPKLFVPMHHDDWAAGITTRGERYEEPLAQELARIPPERRPQVRFIYDPADYVRPEVLTFPLEFAPLRLSRRCDRRGRLRVRLKGDTADVSGVRFRLGRRVRRDRSAPFAARFRPAAIAAARRRGRRPRLRARVTQAGGSVRLRRTLPRCA